MEMAIWDHREKRKWRKEGQKNEEGRYEKAWHAS